MKSTITIDAILTHSPCSEGKEFLAKCKTTAEAWKQCTEPSWMFWALARMRPLSKVESVTLTARFARRVLKHFEEKCPNDKRPLKAIEAAEAWLANPSLRAAAHAANAAHAAASQATAWAEEKLEQCRIIRGVIDLPPTQRK